MKDDYLAGLADEARKRADGLRTDAPRRVRRELTKVAQRLEVHLHASNPESARNVAQERAGLVVYEGGKKR